jgi:tRNA(Arg) A34 adenosine deaminase TadA
VHGISPHLLYVSTIEVIEPIPMLMGALIAIHYKNIYYGSNCADNILVDKLYNNIDN